MMSGWKRKYWTAWTTTTTTLASQWGLLINIDSATGDIPVTANWFIENARFWWYMTRVATSVSAEFDTAVTRTGTKTLKLSTTDVTGRLVVSQRDANLRWIIPVKWSTKYKISCFVKTTNVPSNSARITVEEYNSAGTLWATTNSNTLTGTVDWTLCTATFTTAASAASLIVYCSQNFSWNISDAWFDVNSMTLEEVVEPVANSLVTPSPSLVSFTAVGSTDNIDQSQLTNTWSVSFPNTAQYQAQQFTITKSKFTWITFYKKANVWSPTWTMTFSIVNDSASSPWTTVYATYTYSNAAYLALTTNAEFTVNLPCNLPVWTYWCKISYSVSSATDYPALWWVSPSAYSWLYKYGTDGVTYWTTYNGDAYFKTLYYKPTTNFKASQNNLNVSISADEDGFLNGSVINFLNWTATFTETFSTFYLLQYTISGSDLIAEINLPWNSLAGSFTSDRTLEYSSDGVSYGSTFPTWVTKVWVKILAYSGFASFSYSIQFSTSGLSVLKNYPTNKDIIKQYATTLGAPTTSATYRATKWGFPAIEYSATEYQYLDVDTTATGSTVAFSELWTTYTTVADGASLAISSTSTPNIFVKANITANRLYSSSNDFNASSDKDGSLRQNITYQVVQ